MEEEARGGRGQGYRVDGNLLKGMYGCGLDRPNDPTCVKGIDLEPLHNRTGHTPAPRQSGHPWQVP